MVSDKSRVLLCMCMSRRYHAVPKCKDRWGVIFMYKRSLYSETGSQEEYVYVT